LTHACRSTVHGKASTKAKAMVRTFSLINQQINTSAQKDTNVNNIVTDQINANFSHWATVPLGPPDGILGLNQAFSADSNPKKVNLGVGAYRDDNGKPYILPSVKLAEDNVMKKAEGHEYAGIAGIQSYIDLSLKFAYGESCDVLNSGRIAAVQTLSGTGACRLFGEFINRFVGNGVNMFMPNPTWGNHIPIMKDAGLIPSQYRYYDPKTCAVDFEGMKQDIANASDGSVFMLHACAHNPTGCDPSRAQWDELSSLMKAKNHIVFFDCAYQGFASGDSETDAYSIRKFVSDGHNIILAQSFAKNFGLYGERVGTLSVVCSSSEEMERVSSQLKLLVRPMYSNPPIHGARIVAEILSNDSLRSQWIKECKGMADRIIDMRKSLRSEIEILDRSNSKWNHVTDQIGMFCFTGLTKPQVDLIKSKHAVYCTADGRISMAGVTSKNVKYVAAAICDVKSNA